MKKYKELRRRQKEYRRGLAHSVIVIPPTTPGGGAATSNAVSITSDPANGELADQSIKDGKAIANGTDNVRNVLITHDQFITILNKYLSENNLEITLHVLDCLIN